MKPLYLRLLITNCVFLFMLFLGGCAEYQPPFTHYITPDMDFETVRSVAAEHGYASFKKLAEYRGYQLLDFVKNDGSNEVFLVVDVELRPAMRNFGYGKIDSKQLVHFVDDLILYQDKES